MRTRRLRPDERERIERFVAAYNRVDRSLRSLMKVQKRVPFAVLLTEFGEQHAWPHLAAMKAFHEIRNFLAHRITEPDGYSIIPSKEAVAQLTDIAAALEQPPRVIPTFCRKVVSLQMDATLRRVLALIQENDFSQFPVYRADTFVGLLTENGITRWLARRSKEGGSISLDDSVPVGGILRLEETNRNVAFMAADRQVDEVAVAFRRRPLLEAVIFTASGNRNEKPLGIATQWDVLAR